MEHEEHKHENKVEDEKKNIVATEHVHKAEEKKEIKKQAIKKEQATVNGENLPISVKHAMYICNYIKGKTIDDSIHMLEQVLNYKVALPMKGEVPHRHGKIMSGRYPQNATKEFIRLLKSLRANASVNGIDNPVVFNGIPNLASRPHKRFGSGRFKRTHVLLIAKEFTGGKKK